MKTKRTKFDEFLEGLAFPFVWIGFATGVPIWYGIKKLIDRL